MKIRLEGRLVGEMAVESIPPAPGTDIPAIVGNDDDPLQLVVSIPAGRSSRGWDYRPEALQAIVDHVNRHTLPGYLGHQKPENIEHEFPTPVVHWIGGTFRNGVAYFRGIIDQAATDLKRWIKSGRIRQVSIFGQPQLKRSGGETQVTGFMPFSIDFTPLGRAGMPTRIEAMAGEMAGMDSTFGEPLEVTLGDIFPDEDPAESHEMPRKYTTKKQVPL